MTPDTMAHRFACCEHCPDEGGCPRPEGHAAACRTPGCPSNEPLFGDDPVHEEDYETMTPGVVRDIIALHQDELVVQMRDTLLDAVTSVVGHQPPGVRVLLRALSHPDVAGVAREYFDLVDVESRCRKYEPPWSCAKEAESQYENIKYGWLGAAHGVGFDESWCEACRKKVMGG